MRIYKPDCEIFEKINCQTREKEEQLDRERYCEVCKSKGIKRLATVVDHICDIKDAPHLRLDPDNLRSLFETCHNTKTARMNGNNHSTGLINGLLFITTLDDDD